MYREVDKPQVEWFLTRNILLRYKDVDGNEICDTNIHGQFFCLVGDVIITRALVNESLRFTFESKPMVLRDFTTQVIHQILNQVDKLAENPNNYNLISLFPKKHYV